MLLSLADDDEGQQKPSSLIARSARASSGAGAGATVDADPSPAPLVYVSCSRQSRCA